MVAWPHPFFINQWTPDSLYAGSHTPVTLTPVSLQTTTTADTITTATTHYYYRFTDIIQDNPC